MTHPATTPAIASALNFGADTGESCPGGLGVEGAVIEDEDELRAVRKDLSVELFRVTDEEPGSTSTDVVLADEALVLKEVDAAPMTDVPLAERAGSTAVSPSSVWTR